MCKRTDPNPCQSQKMQPESVSTSVQSTAPPPRRASAVRLISNSGKKARSPKPKENISRVSPVSKNETIKQNSPKPAATHRPEVENRGPSPRGSKRPCQSPNAGLPNASRGMRVASPSKGSIGTVVSSTSEGTVYAGAKFSDPPSPTVLPKPPMHWLSPGSRCGARQSCSEMTNVLKVMLNVQA